MEHRCDGPARKTTDGSSKSCSCWRGSVDMIQFALSLSKGRPCSMRKSPHSPLLLALGMLLLVACSGSAETPTPGVTVTQTPAATGTPSIVQAPSPTPTPPQSPIAVVDSTATAQNPLGNSSLSEEESAALMEAAQSFLSGPNFDDSFISRMGQSGDISFVPVLADLLFLRVPRLSFQLRLALIELTGEASLETWPDWFVWLGRHPEIEPPPGYANWRGKYFGLVDPRISDFFYDGVKARIRLEEIVWGGVARDGIPDLNDAPVIPASQATYLNPGDRVFGVSINGEHRAYPLRILNAHEMANDVVGGEPIALAY